jgi:hypothetical protein
MFARSDIYFRLHLLLIIITTTCISLSLCQTSAPIHLTSVLGVLGTQETFYIIIAGLFERDSFDLFLPEFDKPWVIHLRETCCCSTNLCTWRPNTVYKDRSVRRHQWSIKNYRYVWDVSKGDVRWRLEGPHHLAARPGGDPRHPMVWPAHGPPPSLLWTPSSCREK